MAEDEFQNVWRVGDNGIRERKTKIEREKKKGENHRKRGTRER